MWRYTNTEIKEKTWEKIIKRYPKMQRRSDIAIACMWQHTKNLGEIVPVNVHCPVKSERALHVKRAGAHYGNYFFKERNGLTLTDLRPTRSATVPLTTAPSIAPMVSMEPKTEYCIWARFVSFADEQEARVSFSVKSFTDRVPRPRRGWDHAWCQTEKATSSPPAGCKNSKLACPGKQVLTICPGKTPPVLV